MMIDGEDKKGHELVFGMRVRARVRGEVEEVHFLDVGAAFTQNEVWRAAGYTDIALTPAYFLCDDDGEWRPVSIGNPVLIANRPMPARYTRADINPGISVRKYDRDVLNRSRVTAGELICIGFLAAALMGAVVFPFIQLAFKVGKILHMGIGDRMIVTGLVGLLCARPAVWLLGFFESKAEKVLGIPSAKEWYAN